MCLRHFLSAIWGQVLCSKDNVAIISAERSAKETVFFVLSVFSFSTKRGIADMEKRDIAHDQSFGVHALLEIASRHKAESSAPIMNTSVPLCKLDPARISCSLATGTGAISAAGSYGGSH